MVRRVWVLVVGLLLVACSTRTGGTGPGPAAGADAGPDVDELSVTGAEKVQPAGSLRLSPDGTRVLQLAPGQCVRTLAGGEERCFDRDPVRPDLDNAAWSPDGTKLVFTDDFWRRFLEPDVWVFDVTSGDLRNLTDDGEDEFELSEPNENADLDLLPSWSADGDTIRFARGRAGAETVELMSIPADGGEPSTLREVDCAANALIGLAWSPSRVAWSCGTDTGEVFLADHADGEAERALPTEDGQDRMLLSFSPDGQWLLVDSRNQYGNYSGVEGGLAVAVPAGGGDAVTVAEGAGFPTWSPSGHAIAYVELPHKLMVVAEPGGDPRELRTTEGTFASLDGRRLGWAEGNLLLSDDSEPVLLKLTD